MTAAPRKYGNSIFIFEMANLCIVHLGHLHHTLTQQQLNEIGRPDVVLVPVDGNYTLDLDGMVEVLHALKAPLMIPMHYFSAYTLDRFLDRVRPEWDGGGLRDSLRAGVKEKPAAKAESFSVARPLTVTGLLTAIWDRARAALAACAARMGTYQHPAKDRH